MCQALGSGLRITKRKVRTKGPRDCLRKAEARGRWAEKAVSCLSRLEFEAEGAELEAPQQPQAKVALPVVWGWMHKGPNSSSETKPVNLARSRTVSPRCGCSASQDLQGCSVHQCASSAVSEQSPPAHRAVEHLHCGCAPHRMLYLWSHVLHLSQPMRYTTSVNPSVNNSTSA